MWTGKENALNWLFMSHKEIAMVGVGKGLHAELERLIAARSRFCFINQNFLPIVANGRVADRCKIEQTH